MKGQFNLPLPSGSRPAGQFYSRAFGGTVAAPVWKEFMTLVTEDLPVEEFPEVPEDAKAYYAVPKTQVPSVAGLGANAAARKIQQAGLNAVIVEVPSDQPVGTVLSISPGPGSTVRQGAGVTIEVSSGVPAVQPMPPVIGLTLAEADAVIEQFKAGTGVVITWVRSDVPVVDPTQIGRVIATAPAPGEPITSGQTVTLFLGS